MTDNNELYLELIFAAIKEVNMQQPREYQHGGYNKNTLHLIK